MKLRKMYLDKIGINEWSIPISVFISKNLKAGNLVTFRGRKAIKWFKNQKLMGVYNGDHGLIIKGVALVSEDDYKKYMGNKHDSR